jgi:hypothetical protein
VMLRWGLGFSYIFQHFHDVFVFTFTTEFISSFKNLVPTTKTLTIYVNRR